MIEGWKKIRDVELHSLLSSRTDMRVIKSRRRRLPGNEMTGRVTVLQYLINNAAHNLKIVLMS
jgi:hypothetical protein